jgi:hypothetical protein
LAMAGIVMNVWTCLGKWRTNKSGGRRTSVKILTATSVVDLVDLDA